MQIISLSLSGIVVCLFVLVGYAAVDLQPCDKSRTVFTNSWGVITDGPVGSNYTQDSHCEWLIKANGTNKFITLSFRSMGTECSYDYVFVYDGDSFRSPLLGSFSGKTEPQQVIATSGYMLILLYSDTNYVLDGFRAEFSITDCPNNCTNHGMCFNNVCVCEGDWGGYDCSKKPCPDDCGKALGRGYCNTERCICTRGYSGQSCSLYEYDSDGNKWHWLSYAENGLTPRAAHSAVYVQSTDCLYVFGGYNLSVILSSLEIYSFRNSTWVDEYGKELPGRKLTTAIQPSSIKRLFERAGPVWQQKWGVSPGNSFFKNILYTVSDNTTFGRRRRHSQKSDLLKPAARYGHAACEVDDGFVIFGGKLDNGSLANDLWLFNVHTRSWELRAQFSDIQPPPLTRHSLTIARGIVYLFGGSTADGEFSSRLYKIHLEGDGSENWEEVKARGGKELDVRVVAHTTVYHSASNSLIVYGGIVAGVARFSKLSDRMYVFQLDHRHWTEIHYLREYLRDRFVPRERAFHTANILGNYLVVFGGYSHRHNKEEICYDNQMYLYHLGCHIWVNPEILGKTNDSTYPKQQGVFAHASSIRNGNTLLLVGGYHGNVNGDLLAYTVPPMIAVRKGEHYEPESVCSRHKNYAECSADPECGWCSGVGDEHCYGRTVGANCTTNLQTTRCLGICPALLDCRSCLIHGLPHSEVKPLISAAYKLGLAECTWCVQNARCHHKDDNYGVCGLREDSPSQMPGWWGDKGTEVVKANQCRELDQRPGLTFVKYYHPVNFTQPDTVDIINATATELTSPTSPMLRTESANGTMVGRLLGFLRLPPQWQEELKVCISYCNATLKIGDTQITAFSVEQKDCQSQKWPEKETSNRVSIDFDAQKVVSVGAYNSHQQIGIMQLQHYKEEKNPSVFTFEYLEPYSNGTCSQYTNCQYCLTDSLCGWCELTNSCVSRLEDDSISCAFDGDWRYLTLQPSDCSNCSNYISCESCTQSGLCEWWIEEARCARIGSSPDAATNFSLCPMPCYKRPNCSLCLEQKGRCVWCEATQQCFSFSVYTSEYQFGMCREWLDQAFPLVTPQDNNFLQRPKSQERCKSCSHHTNCTTCLSSLSCGWCFNSSNPITGTCVQGDFNNPHVNCSEVLNIPNARWAYAQCPDVDECGLGLHDCHREAICTNTDGSFSCHCRRGFIGDGRQSCVRTCFNTCVHGVCQSDRNYTCKCHLGWTGDDCSISCGCNNHSDCPDGVGVCQDCQNWTEGEFCELCKAGSYGNATTEQGCHQCECNGHGNVTKGECDIITGVCYCQDNTEGEKCEKCKPNYYGDPRNGKQCYYHCEPRGMLIGREGQGISSRAPKENDSPKECLWIISPKIENGSPIIQLQMNASDLNVTCGENSVYVYDGPPELVDMGSQSSLSAVFCSQEALPSTIVESKTGQLTVHYKKGIVGEGFSAMYNVIECDRCEFPRQCRHGQCLCEEGLVGPNCGQTICPNDCFLMEGHGTCDHNYGRCLCNNGWGGLSCETSLNGTQLVFTELFNTVRLAENVEHLRKTLPRFGHSLSSDRRGSLWMFGGYSLSHGPLNDIRLFDTRNSTWMQVTVDSTPDAKMPYGRYFHGADIVHSKQSIFVYGGLTRTGKNGNNRTLNDFWQFDIQNQRWGEIERDENWPPPLFGHTLTYYRNSSYESLILIGGLSPEYGFLNTVWEYRLDKEVWQVWHAKGLGPLGIFGHSTVFHSLSNSLYIFGGFKYDQQASVLSNNLYILNYDTQTWTDLTSYAPANNLPRMRFLHSAVTTDTHMLIYGGRWNITDTLYAYSYNCNQWINLMSSGIVKVGPLPVHTYAQAMTIEPDGDTAYIIGGWGSDTQCSVLQISLPLDLCSLWSNRSCMSVPDCMYCALKYEDTIVSETCHSKTKKCPLPDVMNRTKNFNQGRLCDGPLSSNCNALKECTTCTQVSECRWCDSFCSHNKTCSVGTVEECPGNECAATDCIQCLQLPKCEWSYSKRQCVSMPSDKQSNGISTCPPPCTYYATCSSCLVHGDCRWSTQLSECISASYQPIYCAGGVCGLVLESEEDHKCPEPCSSFAQCSSCLEHSHCGWCAAPGTMGVGTCVDAPNEKSCEAFMENEQTDNDLRLDRNMTYNWHYCPPENECENNHHNCDPESEKCVDELKGFRCECAFGYKKAEISGCKPDCQQGCVRGKCVKPNKCQCDFGYVGANCSIQCQCNGHSNCEGPDKLDKCLDCQNNTMGAQCEKCKPFFVGDPASSGQCTPCSDYCNGHSSVCVSKNMTDAEIPYDLTELKEGPKGPARCLNCANSTSGARCDGCINGNFRGSEDHTLPCRPCECHGHDDTCDPVTGEKCNCKNNTENDVCQSGVSGKNSAQQPCWTVQCSKCKEGYLGTPKAGHQCYKQLNSQVKMCFDAKPIDECKNKPKPLHPGEMVFLVIQPRYMNVDIRVIIDVTQGKLNVFMSTHDDTFVVYPNQTTGIHEIDLDAQYGEWDNGSKTEDVILERDTTGLRTYISVQKPKPVLAVKSLTDRLVIILPEEHHNLENTRFYIVLQALDPQDTNEKVAYGIVFFQQDQLHIDLFVFFSVFFSCFFLFLAACVVAWKAKQAADVRRARRRQVNEMLHMAKRPFARVTLSLGHRTRTRQFIPYDVKPVAVEPTGDGLAAVITVFVSFPGGQNPSVRLALASSLILHDKQFSAGGRAFLRRRSTHAAPPI